MKKYLLISFVLVLAVGSALAQRQRDGQRDGQHAARVEALKIAHITRELDLTPEESKAFWPIYNEWQKQEKDLRAEMRAFRKDETAREDAEATLNKMLGHIEAEAKLKVEYLRKLNGVMPTEKVVRLPQVERGFKQKLMREMTNRKRQHRQKN